MSITDTLAYARAKHMLDAPSTKSAILRKKTPPFSKLLPSGALLQYSKAHSVVTAEELPLPPPPLQCSMELTAASPVEVTTPAGPPPSPAQPQTPPPSCSPIRAKTPNETLPQTRQGAVLMPCAPIPDCAAYKQSGAAAMPAPAPAARGMGWLRMWPF